MGDEFSTISIGGDFSLQCIVFNDDHANSSLFASARDALMSVVLSQNLGEGVWLVPDFTCPVVPDVIKACGSSVLPYKWLNPWTVDPVDLKKKASTAVGIVVPFYMGLEPNSEIWELLKENTICVVEDRCQCVGLPPSVESIKGWCAIGSYRKWMAVPDGAYCVGRSKQLPRPTNAPNIDMVQFRLAAALTKECRKKGLSEKLDRLLEKVSLELFHIGEAMASHTLGGKAGSIISEHLIKKADFTKIRNQRLKNQTVLLSCLRKISSIRILEPAHGALEQAGLPLLAIPITCEDRDSVRLKLSKHNVFCPIHWRDGDWAKNGGLAAALADKELSLPIDQRYNSHEMEYIARILE